VSDFADITITQKYIRKYGGIREASAGGKHLSRAEHSAKALRLSASVMTPLLWGKGTEVSTRTQQIVTHPSFRREISSFGIGAQREGKKKRQDLNPRRTPVDKSAFK